MRQYVLEEKPDGTAEFTGLTMQGFRLAFAHSKAWERFRMARAFGDFGGMITAELNARAAEERLTDQLRREGFEESDIADMLASHRRSNADPDWNELIK